MKIIELAHEGDPHPAMREGAILRLEPVIGESGKVAAHRVIDDRDGPQVAVVPASSVKVERS
jgi:hypothetical protein